MYSVYAARIDFVERVNEYVRKRRVAVLGCRYLYIYNTRVKDDGERMRRRRERKERKERKQMKEDETKTKAQDEDE